MPHTPLGVDLTADIAMAKQVTELRKVTLALAKTDRAPNSLNVTGRIDMTKSNAWTGNLKITSDGLDVTPYYDLFVGKPTETKSSLPPRFFCKLWPVVPAPLICALVIRSPFI